MPLKPGSSKLTFSHNVKEMFEAGHPLKQALAAAYRMKRMRKQAEAKRKKM